MASVRQLPAGFRYLFTAKEAKAIAAAASVQFTTITTGGITAAGRVQADSVLQATFRAPSLDAYYAANEWHFRFHQPGFRKELLPPEAEQSVKTAIQARFTAFIQRVLSTRETDFLRSPGIWAHVTLTKSKATVSYTEHK